MRKRRAVKRDVLPDPIYNSKVVTKLVNQIMLDGKKGTAQEVKSRRVGGSNYQVPMEVNDERAQTLALRWLVNYAKLRNGKGMAINLANEIIDASNGTGGACKKREDTHRMAEANKAFAHYRW